MKREAVDSSNIKSIGYEAGSQTLEVEFNSGGVYHYFKVPVSIHLGIMAAESKGKYLAQYVKPTFKYKKIKEEVKKK